MKTFILGGKASSDMAYHYVEYELKTSDEKKEKILRVHLKT
jgi:hypothetical protein